MYPRISWELVVDSLGSAEHPLGTTAIEHCPITFSSFYIHGSVLRDSILIRSNEMQQYAGVYLLHNYSTCFGCLSHPSSGVLQIVTAASSTGHSVRATWPLGHVALTL